MKRLWDQGIENPEVRNLLLQIVAAGKLGGCADIAYTVAMGGTRMVHERSLAIEALSQMNDPRLEALAISVETDPARWPDAATLNAVFELFPTCMPVARLSQILRRLKKKPRTVDHLKHRLPYEIEAAELSPKYLDQLRQAMTDLIVDGITWERNKFPHLRTKRPDLIAALVEACRRQAQKASRRSRGLHLACLRFVSQKRTTGKMKLRQRCDEYSQG